MIVINLKTYKEATGKNAVEIAKKCEKYKNILIAAQLSDIYRITKETKTAVIAQHIDAARQGRDTGFVTAEAVKEAGAVGTLINHSEHQLPFEAIKRTIERAKENKLITIVCADTPEKAAEIAKLNPDYIAIEPPELIAGDISVSTAKPEIITNTIKSVNKIKKIPVLCGAGIKSRQDVKKAIELGAKGVLVASGIVKAENQEKAIKEIAEGLREH